MPLEKYEDIPLLYGAKIALCGFESALENKIK